MNYNNYETIEIKTDRLILKRGSFEDYLKVYEYDFNKLSGVNQVVSFERQNIRKIKSWFKGGMKNYYKKLVKAHMFDWIIYDNQEPVGNVLTGDEDLENNSIELMVNVHPSFWGRSYAKEALSVTLDYLFKIGYEGVTCKYLDGNLKAKKLVEKLGFKPYKIKMDAYYNGDSDIIDEYVLIMKKEDWLSKTQKIKKIKVSL